MPPLPAALPIAEPSLAKQELTTEGSDGITRRDCPLPPTPSASAAAPFWNFEILLIPLGVCLFCLLCARPWQL